MKKFHELFAQPSYIVKLFLGNATDANVHYNDQQSSKYGCGEYSSYNDQQASSNDDVIGTA